MPLGIETSDCSDHVKSPATTGVEPAGGAVAGGGWGQSLPDDGPSLYGPSRPKVEECSPEVGSLVPEEVGSTKLPRDSRAHRRSMYFLRPSSPQLLMIPARFGVSVRSSSTRPSSAVRCHFVASATNCRS